MSLRLCVVVLFILFCFCSCTSQDENTGVSDCETLQQDTVWHGKFPEDVLRVIYSLAYLNSKHHTTKTFPLLSRQCDALFGRVKMMETNAEFRKDFLEQFSRSWTWRKPVSRFDLVLDQAEHDQLLISMANDDAKILASACRKLLSRGAMSDFDEQRFGDVAYSFRLCDILLKKDIFATLNDKGHECIRNMVCGNFGRPVRFLDNIAASGRSFPEKQDLFVLFLTANHGFRARFLSRLDLDEGNVVALAIIVTLVAKERLGPEYIVDGIVEQAELQKKWYSYLGVFFALCFDCLDISTEAKERVLGYFTSVSTICREILDAVKAQGSAIVGFIEFLKRHDRLIKQHYASRKPVQFSISASMNAQSSAIAGIYECCKFCAESTFVKSSAKMSSDIILAEIGNIIFSLDSFEAMPHWVWSLLSRDRSAIVRLLSNVLSGQMRSEFISHFADELGRRHGDENVSQLILALCMQYVTEDVGTFLVQYFSETLHKDTYLILALTRADCTKPWSEEHHESICKAIILSLDEEEGFKQLDFSGKLLNSWESLLRQCDSFKCLKFMSMLSEHERNMLFNDATQILKVLRLSSLERDKFSVISAMKILTDRQFSVIFSDSLWDETFALIEKAQDYILQYFPAGFYRIVRLDVNNFTKFRDFLSQSNAYRLNEVMYRVLLDNPDVYAAEIFPPDFARSLMHWFCVSRKECVFDRESVRTFLEFLRSIVKPEDWSILFK